MSLVTASGEIRQGMKVARTVWEETRKIWRDSVAENFEKRYWTPLDDEVAAAAEAMDRLAPELAKLIRECS